MRAARLAAALAALLVAASAGLLAILLLRPGLAVPRSAPTAADRASLAPLSTASPPPLPARLLFVQAGNFWLLETPGRPPRRLTDFPTDGFVADPALSPDRRLLAYARLTRPADQRQPATQDLYLANADGSAERRLVPAEPPEAYLRAPAWAPDACSGAV